VTLRPPSSNAIIPQCKPSKKLGLDPANSLPVNQAIPAAAQRANTASLNWHAREEVRSQSVTEYSYNNNLAYHHIWSTIKTLPATLPEPKNPVPRCKRRHQNIKVLGPRSLEREILTGVTGAVSESGLELVKG
jgi:hypothetical protein